MISSRTYFVTFNPKMMVLGPYAFNEIERRASDGEFGDDYLVAESIGGGNESSGDDNLRWISLRDFLLSTDLRSAASSELNRSVKPLTALSVVLMAAAAALFAGLITAFAITKLAVYIAGPDNSPASEHGLVSLLMFLKFGLITGFVSFLVVFQLGRHLLYQHFLLQPRDEPPGFPVVMKKR